MFGGAYGYVQNIAKKFQRMTISSRNSSGGEEACFQQEEPADKQWADSINQSLQAKDIILRDYVYSSNIVEIGL
jgi:hypothetical protein